jgi:hypothetical protein
VRSVHGIIAKLGFFGRLANLDDFSMKVVSGALS